MGFDQQYLDFTLVPFGLLILSTYHAWLLYRIIKHPTTTVIGLNALNREIWVDTMMADGIKNGVLAVQTLRNNIMASTLLGSTAITLSSLIGVLVSSTNGSGAASALIYGDHSRIGSSIKYFTILVCFLIAFVCNLQSIRYYSHVSFLINVPKDKYLPAHSLIYFVSKALNRGSYFWSLGLRAFYFSFPLFLWIFGPLPMFVCCCSMVGVLYFLDTATHFTQTLSLHGRADVDVEQCSSPTPHSPPLQTKCNNPN
ncbi:hypothetical protein SUGI_0130640 [Cryptomeria japonica]|uniref:uncharacterized protein LOC131037128 isoform X1 n=1 Tax=Cryptomeria japonica TaxID=3369 RepID=UPI002408DB4D|nr:uncharacterized protein LOC131037128 isoform X1 [Cryptomeria japonica]GLJ10563.1 hypothetical protein SUGI_0130640 [Cryptomeria japonica]